MAARTTPPARTAQRSARLAALAAAFVLLLVRSLPAPADDAVPLPPPRPDPPAASSDGPVSPDAVENGVVVGDDPGPAGLDGSGDEDGLVPEDTIPGDAVPQDGLDAVGQPQRLQGAPPGQPDVRQAHPVSDAPVTLVSLPGPKVDFLLQAEIADDQPPLDAGLTWRVFGERPDATGRLPLVAEADGGSIHVALPPGAYFVHAAYGRAGATKRVVIPATPGSSDIIVLNAGGLRLTAMAGEDVPLPAAQVSYDIFAEDDATGERVMLVPGAPGSQVIRMNAGTYYVVCRYGEANAIVRAEITVQAGKLTDATIFQRAAKLTLKLVSETGGEAFANTAWSVVTANGESVFESIGAFPAVILAAGEYTAIAKHDGMIYERTFTVENAINRDVEVMAEGGHPVSAPGSPPG